KNLFDKIAVAHRNNIEFILIVDEEHSNNTKKAEYMINAFAPTHELRVSATTKKNSLYNYYEIDEMDVIDEGLITKALYINEDVEDNIKIDNEHEYLIKLADQKRISINKKYKDLKKDIRPLVLIQFPDSSNILIEDVENMLESMGYTYENKLVAKWMSDADDKINIDGIEDNNAYPVFLLMKQAISTGWDCPRAKILIKLREKMDEDFTIQTIGRLRRMPESTHYEEMLLDNCFLYTFDEEYKQSVMHDITNSFQRKTVFLKEKCKTFTLKKEIKDETLQGLGERETCEIVYKHFVNKYGLKKSSSNNELKFKEAKYKFDEQLLSYARKGEFINTESILDDKQGETIKTYREVDTHKNGVDLWTAVNKIRTGIGLDYDIARAIVNRLFAKSIQDKYNLLDLNKSQSYAFIINNADLLKRDFKEALSGETVPNTLQIAKHGTFRIPEIEKIKFDAAYRDAVIVNSNAYDEYYSSVWVKKIRSYPESKFEEYCEGNSNVDWVYKNGDSGSDYFSIVYTDLKNKQWHFYPDYIVKLKNGEVWIIEAKGGESDSGDTKNIDLQAQN
ncbi:MAG: DNA helicase, partial [Clostridium sp.]